MRFTINILKNMVSYGEEICVFSNQFSKILTKYPASNFPNYSFRLYYYWKNEQKAIPLSVVIALMKKEGIKYAELSNFSIRGGNKLILPDENSHFFSYFLGLILGDGCLVQTKRGNNKSSCRVQISFREKEEAEKGRVLASYLFDIAPSIYPNSGCFDLCIFSKPLVFILNKKHQIPIGKKYSQITVPEIILSGKLKNKIAFLKGVFESDGNIYLHKKKQSVQLRQKSEFFLRQIWQLFHEAGINFNKPYYDTANCSWLLWSSKKELVDNFINKIIAFKLEAPVAQPG